MSPTPHPASSSSLPSRELNFTKNHSYPITIFSIVPRPLYPYQAGFFEMTAFITRNTRNTSRKHEKHNFHSKTTITRSKNTPDSAPQEVKPDLKHLSASGTPLIFYTDSRGKGWEKNPQRVYLPLSPLIPVK